MCHANSHLTRPLNCRIYSGDKLVEASTNHHSVITSNEELIYPTETKGEDATAAVSVGNSTISVFFTDLFSGQGKLLEMLGSFICYCPLPLIMMGLVVKVVWHIAKRMDFLKRQLIDIEFRLERQCQKLEQQNSTVEFCRTAMETAQKTIVQYLCHRVGVDRLEWTRLSLQGKIAELYRRSHVEKQSSRDMNAADISAILYRFVPYTSMALDADNTCCQDEL